MSRGAFKRERHRLVAQALDAFNRALLAGARCYFGGGTRIVLELDEYRESADLDFLCADAAGYRTLRNAVSEGSLGSILARPLPLAREVRSDRYGIRTFLEIGETKLKTEIILEGRIDLSGGPVPGIGVDCLDQASCFAEKFLANADRWNDEAVASRDLVDLAFMISAWPASAAQRGLQIAGEAYGAIAADSLDRAIAKLKGDALYRRRCLHVLTVQDEATLLRGIARLSGKKWRKAVI